MIYKLDNGGIVKLQNAWTTMPSVEDAILRAWSNQNAKEKAKKQVASEKPKYTYVNPYDYLHGWREATEDAAKQDKYTVENLGGSKEEAEAAYNASKENAAKQLAGTTATGLGTVALLGLSGGAAGPVAADIVNTGFGAHGLYNALSGNGIQKTVRLANQGDTWGAVKSGAGDLLDLSMGLHAAKLWGNLGKSMLAGQSLGNAYRGNIVGREMSNLARKATTYSTPVELNNTISFTPRLRFTNTVHFDPRVKPLSRPISEAEKLGIPKNERPMYDPEVFQKAKLFAEEYGYSEPKTPTEIKDMYKRHNTFFRTVGDLDRVYFPKNYESLPDEFKSLSLPEQRKFLASRGYPSYLRGYFDNIEGPFSDEFVFVSPSLEENADYFINNALDNTVKLQRPFSLRDPKKWHIEADWRIHPANSWKERWWPKGRIEIGNASPSREFKVSTKHLIPVDIAKQDDLGTLLPQYFRKRINDAISKDWWERPKWLQEDYNGNYEIDYLGILPEKFNYKQGGILKAQKGTPSFVTPMTNQFTTKLMEFLEKYRRKGPAPQKAVGPAVWAYSKSSKIADDGGKIS